MWQPRAALDFMESAEPANVQVKRFLQEELGLDAGAATAQTDAKAIIDNAQKALKGDVPSILQIVGKFGEYKAKFTNAAAKAPALVEGLLTLVNQSGDPAGIVTKDGKRYVSGAWLLKPGNAKQMNPTGVIKGFNV